MSKNIVSILIQAKDLATGRLKAVAGSMRSLAARMRAARRGAGDLHTAMQALLVGLAVRQIIQMSDAATNLENRLQLVTNSTAELVRTQRQLFVLAQNTRSEWGATSGLYARLARSTEELNYSQGQLLSITRAVNQSFQISGAGAQEASAAIIQLGQGLASETLRGDELRSVMEQAPRLARAIADGMGVSIGELRKMGAEGELTSQKVTEAILSQANRINTEYQKLNYTFGQVFSRMWNSMTNLTDATDDTSGVLDFSKKSVLGWSALIDEMAKSLRKYNDELEKTDRLSRAMARDAAIMRDGAKTGKIVGPGTGLDLEAEFKRSEESFANLKKAVNTFVGERMNPMLVKAKKVTAEYQKQIDKVKKAKLETQSGLDLVHELEEARDRELALLAKRSEFQLAAVNAEQALQLRMRESAAQAETSLAKLESQFASHEISLQQYYATRRSLVESTTRLEIDQVNQLASARAKALRQQAGLETNPEKKAAFESEAKQTLAEAAARVLELEQRRVQVLSQLTVQEREAARERKQQSEDLLLDIRQRGLNPLNKKAQHDLELEELRLKHERELTQLREFGASKAEIEDAQAAHTKEIKKKEVQYEKNAQQEKLAVLSEFTSAMGSTLVMLNQMGLQNSKEGFAVYKAFATAEAIIATYTAAVKAYDNGVEGGGPYAGVALGTAYAALAIAQGLAKVALINSAQPKGYAFGGLISGPDQGTRADNVTIRATPGEYMMDRPAVEHYGVGIMDALRRRKVPKAMLEGLAVPSLSAPGPRMGFAYGGQIRPQDGADQPGRGDEFTIVNVMDRSQLDQYLASAAGQRVIMNTISANGPVIRRIARGEQ